MVDHKEAAFYHQLNSLRIKGWDPTPTNDNSYWNLFYPDRVRDELDMWDTIVDANFVSLADAFLWVSGFEEAIKFVKEQKVNEVQSD